MAVGTGYSKIITNGLIYAHDINDTKNSFKGEPTVNICTGNQYSIYNSGASNYRDNTEVSPPVPGYEVVKVVADSQGSYGQSILWNATYNNSVVTITNSVYAYLTAGSYVQVGQHWFPWNYGAAEYIPKNQWVRISNTYTINEGGSYGSAAMVYSTDGVAYFSMPQYEVKNYATPFVTFQNSRDSTQVLYNLSNNNYLDLSSVSYDSNGKVTFDGSNDRFDTGITNVVNDASYEVVLNCKGNVSTYNMYMGQYLPYLCVYGGNRIYYSDHINGSQTQISTEPGTIAYNTYYHVVCTREYDGSSTTQKIYINGTLYTSGTFSGAKSAFYSPDTINIGDGAAFTWYPFYGDVPVAKVYSRTLSAGEIKQNYGHYKTRFNLS